MSRKYYLLLGVLAVVPIVNAAVAFAAVAFA